MKDYDIKKDNKVIKNTVDLNKAMFMIGFIFLTTAFMLLIASLILCCFNIEHNIMSRILNGASITCIALAVGYIILSALYVIVDSIYDRGHERI